MVLFIIIACLMFKIQSMSLSVLNYQLEKVQARYCPILKSLYQYIHDDIIKIHESCIPGYKPAWIPKTYCILSLVKQLYITMDKMANLSVGVYIKV